MKKNGQPKFKMPHAYVLIVGLIIIAAVLTYILPAGVYDKIEVDGRKVVDPHSYHYVEQSPVGPWGVLTAIPQGLHKAASIMFTIIVISGSIEIINATGTLEASIGRVVRTFKDKPSIVMPLVLLCFVALGAVGVSNAIVAFMPLGLLLAFNVGADALVGIALVGMGMNIGFTGGAFLAPTTRYSTVNHRTSHVLRLGVPVDLYGSALGFRFHLYYPLCKEGTTGSTLSYVYAVEGVTTPAAVDEETIPEFTSRRKLVLLAFVIGFAFVVYGAIQSWSAADEIPAVFLAMGIVCGLLYGFSPSASPKSLSKGQRK